MNTRVHNLQNPSRAGTPPLFPALLSPAVTLQRKCACGGSGGDCEECKRKQQTTQSPSVHAVAAAPRLANGSSGSVGHNFGQVRVDQVRTPAVPAGLRISQPGDETEREADRVADEVMRMPAPIRTVEPARLRQFATPTLPPAVSDSLPTLQRQPAGEDEETQRAGGPVDYDMPKPEYTTQCPGPAEVQHQREEGLQRRCSDVETPATAPEVSGNAAASAPAVGELISGGGGRALSPAARAFFEPRFGYAFDHVRVHADGPAAASARAFQARAYTVGNHIVFGAGEYTPDNRAGCRLLAHELTHVLQQTPARPLPMSSDHVNPPLRIGAQFVGTTALQRWSIGDPVAGINTIICDGSGGVTTQLGATGNADQTRCLKDCIEAHEQSHRSDALAEKANICSGTPAGKTVRPDAGAQQKATEIKASNVEIGCLTPQLDKVGEVCKGIMQGRITQMQAYRDSFK
jgi:Domain of unknown function (DUF4157)